ncbi:MAG: sarcosine oxidase subunit delta [Pseudomonadota bacterium]|nr:sarcosine oxidase subunit delta [Pseudomonadota bacterium]
MQLFPCPFCGPRAETEFAFGGEAGKARPEGEVSDLAWSRYLYAEANRKGAAREIWVHLTCGEFFAMERDTVSHVVSSTSTLRAAS